MGSSPPADTHPLDLSLATLRSEYPHEYALWIRIGTVAAAFGYAVSSIAIAIDNSLAALPRYSDPYAFVVQLVALFAVLSGRTRTAALLVAVGVWLDVHVSLITFGTPKAYAASAALPVLMVAVGFLLGGRVARALMFTNLLSVPAALWLSDVFGISDGLRDPGVVTFLAVTSVVSIATYALMAGFLRTMSRILWRSRSSDQRATQLTEELQHAQKLEALGQLAGGIAHDFNNLLTAVSGYGSLLATSTDPEAREFSSEVIAVQERGAALVRQLLAFARKDMVTPKPMDVGTVVTQTALLVQRMLGERIKLVLDVQETCPIVADPGQVEQVILNLAANARDAMPNGGSLRVTCRTHGDVVALDVTDTGQGMSEVTKQRLFEPFFTTKPVGQGTGLGLSTVHGIVKASAGTIEVTSTLGEGTRFSIRWPRTSLPTDDLSAPTPTPHSDGDGRLVIVVEDNDAARAFMKRLLERKGFVVQVARDGDEATALLKARQAPPDLLLTDVIMPGITGPQLVRNTLERWPNLRFLFVSGYLGDEAESFGFDPERDLLTKPFTADALLMRIAIKLESKTERSSQPGNDGSKEVAVNVRSGGTA